MAEEKRIELVEPAPDPDHRAQRIGLGLLGSMVLGWAPLNDAFHGNGSFEGAIARFLLCVIVSVGAVLFLGRLLDGAPDPEPADDGSSSGSDRTTDTVMD